MFEPPDEARGGFLTRPFPLEWSVFSRVVTQRGMPHRMHSETGELLPTGDDSDGAEALWLWDSPCRARLFFGTEALQRTSQRWGIGDAGTLVGWSLENVTDPVLIVAERNGGNQIRVRALNPAKGARLHLACLYEGSEEHVGPADGLSVDAPEDGFRFVLCEPGNDGRGNHIRMFEPQGGQWNYRWQDGATVCAATGLAIRGRQDFVALHTARTELLVFEAELLKHWPPQLSAGCWAGLAGGSGERLDTEVNVLRYRAWLAATLGRE